MVAHRGEAVIGTTRTCYRGSVCEAIRGSGRPFDPRIGDYLSPARDLGLDVFAEFVRSGRCHQRAFSLVSWPVSLGTPSTAELAGFHGSMSYPASHSSARSRNASGTVGPGIGLGRLEGQARHTSAMKRSAWRLRSPTPPAAPARCRRRAACPPCVGKVAVIGAVQRKGNVIARVLGRMSRASASFRAGNRFYKG